jgi:DNA-binding transcriptional regulator YiaG
VEFLKKRFKIQSKKDHYENEHEISGKECLLFAPGNFDSMKKLSDVDKEQHEYQSYNDLANQSVFDYKTILKKTDEIQKNVISSSKCIDITKEANKIFEEDIALNNEHLYFIFSIDEIRFLLKQNKISKKKFSLDIIYCIRKKVLEKNKKNKCIIKRKINFNQNMGIIISADVSDFQLLNLNS